MMQASGGGVGQPCKADAELMKAREAGRKLDIRPCSQPNERAFAGEWQEGWARFVDEYRSARSHVADALVEDIIEARGYPVDDFEQRAADISVEHPRLVETIAQLTEITRPPS